MKTIVCISIVLYVNSYAINDDYGELEEKPLLVIVPSYNNKPWYIKNLDSIFSQNYSNYHVVYIADDCTDGTEVVVPDYIEKHGLESKFTFIVNEYNKGALANIYNAIHDYAHDDDIIVTIDGDDWLAHNNVFKVINKAYADPNVWLTYGEYVLCPSSSCPSVCAEIPRKVIKNNAYRKYPWAASHLRTFYAALFKKIKKEDLYDGDDFYRVTWDQALMYPMLEMAAGRWKYIKEIIYIYNVGNPLNDYKHRLRKQRIAEKKIKSQAPYMPIESLW